MPRSASPLVSAAIASALVGTVLTMTVRPSAARIVLAAKLFTKGSSMKAAGTASRISAARTD